MNSSAPNSGMVRMDGFAKAFGAVSAVTSTVWGYAKQLPSSHINGIDWCGKAFGAVSGVSSAACGYANQLSNSATVQQKLNILGVQSSQITDLLSLNGMCTGLGAVATVGVAAWGMYMLVGGLVKIVLFTACVVYKPVVGLVKKVCFEVWHVCKLVVGLVKKVFFAPWRVYKQLGGPGKKKMMKNPGRPWERIDANEFRNDPVARKAKFDRTHKLNKAGKCAKGIL